MPPCRPARTAGVESYDVNLAEQKVVVKGNVTPEAVVEKVGSLGAWPRRSIHVKSQPRLLQL